MANHGGIWSTTVEYGQVWWILPKYVGIWLTMAKCGGFWPTMLEYGQLYWNMVDIGGIWPTLG